MIKKSAAKGRKTKTASILKSVDEKLGLVKNREQVVRSLQAGFPMKRLKN